MAIDQILFASNIVILIYGVLALIHVGASLYIITKNKAELTTGHIRRFINTFSFTLAIAFLYAVWNIFLRLKLINIDFYYTTLLDNLILVIFFMSLAYVAYLSRDLSKKFGFKNLGMKVGKVAKTKS